MYYNFFDDCFTATEIKARYRALAKKYHPDVQGGNKELFQRLQSAFSIAWERCKDIHVSHTGETYKSPTDETAQEYMDIIEHLMRMQGVHTELIGSWLWASGNTKRYASELKALGFRFSKPKTAWYYHRGSYRRHHDREYTLDDIRSMYNHQSFAHHKDDKREGKLYVAAH